MFNIYLTDESDELLGENVYKGHIVAGELNEYFRSEVNWWSKDDYKRSWLREIIRFLEGETDVAVLITTFVPPENANFLRGYVLYGFGDDVLIQEQMFVVESLGYVFDPYSPGDFLKYSSTTEEGEKKSEWRMEKEDLRTFVSNCDSF